LLIEAVKEHTTEIKKLSERIVQCESARGGRDRARVGDLFE
jgi:hypothetical protein